MPIIISGGGGGGGGSATFHGAYAWRSTGTVDGLQTFDQEAWDTDNFHSTVSNTSRMTIPAGYLNAYWLLIAYGRTATPDPNNPAAFFLKNGTEQGGRQQEQYVTGAHFTAVCSTMLDRASAGDYYEWNCTNGNGLLAGGTLAQANVPTLQIMLVGS